MSRRTEIQVGITVLVALGILLWGVTWLKEFSINRRIKVWHVMFAQTGGLGASDEVQVNGIRKGSVQGMRLVGDEVVVDLALASDVALTRDSRVAIRNVGLMGEKVIAVDLKTTGGDYATADTIQSHAAALAYVDRQLPPLFAALRRRGPCLCVVCSDHGTAYGEDGYHGHRLAHPVVWTVPYAEFVLPRVTP